MPVPVPVPCHLRPSPNKVGACRPARVNIYRPRQTSLPGNLGKSISQDSMLTVKLGWEDFVNQRRERGDLSSLEALPYPARRLFRQYKDRGAPVVLSEKNWTEGHRQAAIVRGPHCSEMEHTPFIRKEFASMVGKGQWIVLPYSVTRNLPGLRLSPPGFKE